MPSIKVTVDIEIDGVRLGDFPFSHRVQITQEQAFALQQASGGGYVALSQLSPETVLALKSDQQVSLEINGVAAPIVLNPNGFIVIVDGAISAVTVNNASSTTANLEGVIAG